MRTMYEAEAFDDDVMPEPPRERGRAGQWLWALAENLEKMARPRAVADGIDPCSVDALNRLSVLQTQCVAEIRSVAESFGGEPGGEWGRAILLVRGSWDLARRLEQRKRRIIGSFGCDGPGGSD